MELIKSLGWAQIQRTQSMKEKQSAKIGIKMQEYKPVSVHSRRCNRSIDGTAYVSSLHLFLAALEAGRSTIMADLVSGGTCFQV